MAGAALAEQLLNGLTIGVVYVLIAAGLSIIFGVMDVINFVHGELFALGAYFAFALAAPFGGAGFWVALVVSPLLVGAIGMAIERLTIRPLYDRNPLYHILLTFGLVLVVADLVTIVWGRQGLPFSPPPALSGPISIFGFTYATYNYFIVGFGALLALLAWYVLTRTRFGLIVRAGAQDREMVRDLGIDIDRYYTLVFGFGAALAGIAGVVLGAYQGIDPSMGSSVIIPAFVIVILGGLGSFRGAVVGGLGVGILQSLTRVYVPFFEGLVIYLLMIAVLLVRPTGLFGDPEWNADAETDAGLLVGRAGGLLDARTRYRLGVACVALLALVPLGAGRLYSPFVVTLLTDVLIWALFALSLDFVMGYAGLVSLGHAMFYGIGAYAAVLSLLHVDGSAPLALVVAVAVAAALAWVVGYLSIRVSGVYFAMITLAFAQLLYNLVFKFDFTGGSDGLFGVDPYYGLGGVGVRLEEIQVGLGAVQITGDGLFYYVVLACVVGGYLLARRVMGAPFGSVLRAIRESETRTSFIGYDVTTYKRRAFVASGALAGLSGGLFALGEGFVAPSLLYWLRSGEVIVMTVLGGMGTLYGPMVGAGVYVTFADLVSSDVAYWRLVLGSVFVLFVVFVPRGLVSLPATLVSTLDRGRGGPGSATDARADGGSLARTEGDEDEEKESGSASEATR
jgi:branched-chain amino acid transport system permease protein